MNLSKLLFNSFSLDGDKVTTTNHFGCFLQKAGGEPCHDVPGVFCLHFLHSDCICEICNIIYICFK